MLTGNSMLACGHLDLPVGWSMSCHTTATAHRCCRAWHLAVVQNPEGNTQQVGVVLGLSFSACNGACTGWLFAFLLTGIERQGVRMVRRQCSTMCAAYRVRTEAIVGLCRRVLPDCGFGRWWESVKCATHVSHLKCNAWKLHCFVRAGLLVRTAVGR